ncbi:MAG: hypothetical protein KBC64_00475 [Simkaniaceae bacterium]|nr:hypothetical protein [Simkaniaceae bacterium]
MLKLINKFGLVIVFTFISLGCYGFAAQHKEARYHELNEMMTHLSVQMEQAKKEQGMLKLRLNSLNDPEWVQMLLMRDLGVLPDGQVKIVFSR